MANCPSLASGDAFLGSLLGHVDCQARTMGDLGYRALADPSSPVSIALTGLLVLFVALLGLRMALGATPSRRDALAAVIRIGVVLVLAGSWSAWRTVIYDVVIEAPTELAGIISRANGLPGADGDLIARLQNVDSAIIRLTDLGTGRDPGAALLSASGEPPRRYPIADDPAFGWARVVFLAAVISAFATVRLSAGLLLALTPVFAAFLLLSPTRSLATGWARALAFCVFGSLASSVLFGVHLALMEPWLAQVLQSRLAGGLAGAAPVELLVLSVAFAMTVFASLGIILRLCFTWRTPSRQVLSGPMPMPEGTMPSWPVVAETPRHTALRLEPAGGVPALPSRAAALAANLSAIQRREHATDFRNSGSGGRRTETAATSSPPPDQVQSRARSRKSLASALRDKR